MKLLTFLFSGLFIMSCGSDSSSSLSDSSKLNIFPDPYMSCDTESCIDSSKILHSKAGDPATYYATLSSAYIEGRSYIEDDLITSLTNIENILKLAGYTDCSSIPSDGSTIEVNYQGNDMDLSFTSGATSTIYGEIINFEKKITISFLDNDVAFKFFQAYLTCDETKAAIIEANLDIIPGNEYYRYKIVLYQNGNTKKTTLYQEVPSTKSIATDKYMVDFSTSGGKSFTASIGDTVGDGIMVMQQNSSGDLFRLAYGSGTFDLQYSSSFSVNVLPNICLTPTTLPEPSCAWDYPGLEYSGVYPNPITEHFQVSSSLKSALPTTLGGIIFSNFVSL